MTRDARRRRVEEETTVRRGGWEDWIGGRAGRARRVEPARDARVRRRRRGGGRLGGAWKKPTRRSTHFLLAEHLEGLAPLELALQTVHHLLRRGLDLVHRSLELLHVLLVLLLDELDGVLGILLRLSPEVVEPAVVLLGLRLALGRRRRLFGGVRRRTGLPGVRHGGRAVCSHRRAARPRVPSSAPPRPASGQMINGLAGVLC